MTTPNPSVKLIIGSLAMLMLLAVLGWAVGLDWPHAVLLAVVIVAAADLRWMPATNTEQAWQAREDYRTDQGARREVARLSWALQGYEARVERSTVRRLRAIATRRLAIRGLDLDRPQHEVRCRQVLGDQPYAMLTADPFLRPPYGEFLAALAAVEALNPEALTPGAVTPEALTTEALRPSRETR